VAINCAALPEALLESELFGHVRGAFTGAVCEKKGLFEEADGGTLLLDEIGDMPPALQAKLLRVLQEREVRRVGATTNRRVDVRAIASTHHDMADLIARGGFREDLYYRLAVIPIVVPPLRERRDDILPLVQHFSAACARRAAAPVRAFSPEAIARMMSYDWPGNIRELSNVVERAITLTASPVVSGAEFDAVFALGRPAAGPPPATPPATPPAALPAVEPRERATIVRALEAHGWNHTKAAETLGVARNTLWRKMKRMQIHRPG
jgi:transcriptional regulator with PAS, ATPase and Fis domain